MSCTSDDNSRYTHKDQSVHDIKKECDNVLCEDVVRLCPAPGACLCCLGETHLESIFSTHHTQNKMEVYSEMLLNYLNVEILVDDTLTMDLYQICEACILRLRDACDFKYQICSTQQQLKSSRIKNEHDETDCKHDSFFYDSDSPIGNQMFSKPNKRSQERKSARIKSKLKTTKKSLTTSSNAQKSKRKKGKVKLSDKTKMLSPYERSSPSFKSAFEQDAVGTLCNNKSEFCGKSRNKYEMNNAFCEDKKGKVKYMEKAPYMLEKDALICPFCSETFPLHSALVRHMPIHFPNFICDICAKIFDSRSKIAKHLALHRAKVYKCHICEKLYRGADNLRSHIQRHSKHHFYKCPYCPQRFQSYHTRLKHLIQIHNEEPKKYQCKQCSKSYFLGSALTRHVKRVHLQERPYICAVCGDGFFAKTELSDHMRKHTGVKNFKCTVCLKSYGRKYTLKEHMRIHNNDKRFVCPSCGRAFTQKCTLKAHLKTHEKSVTKNYDDIDNAVHVT